LSSCWLTSIFGADPDHRLELTLVGRLSKNTEQDLGVQFVIDQAEKKRKSVARSEHRAVLMDVAGVVHWQVGAGNCVFTVTLTAPLPMSKELDNFLNGPLNEIVDNVRCNGL
jgi:hypothetical protein